MADTSIPITPGTGAAIDTRTTPDGDHRQVLVLGDPATTATATITAGGALQIRPQIGTLTTAVIANGGSGTAGPIDVSELGNLTIFVQPQAAATAWTNNPVLVFEQSYDNVQWAALAVARNDSGIVASTHTLPTGAPSTAIAFNVGLLGCNYVRVRVTTGPTGGGLTIAFEPGGWPFNPIVSTQLPVRSPSVYYNSTPAATTATDSLIALNVTRANVAVGATATPAVIPAGRTLRLQQMTVSYIATATTGYALVRLRLNPAGLAAATSNVLRQVTVGATTPASANSVGMVHVDFGDGIDVPAGAGVGVSTIGVNGVTAAAAGYVQVTLSGYEF